MLETENVKEGKIKGAYYAGHVFPLENGEYVASVVAVEPGLDAFGAHRTCTCPNREAAIKEVYTLWSNLEKELD
ncbi:hypothetical protein [Paenibacillus sp. NPDC057934]|uniref:hypothetical protein n=1 Tax=Paenibacillus sp. NPDC057934 TaxID=3346282 RepID=UPI0036D7BBDD